MVFSKALAMAELVLDESRFTERIQLQALRVPKRICSKVAKLLNGYMLNKPRLKHVVEDPADTESRLVLLSDSVKNLHEIPEERLNSLKELVSLDIVSHELVLGYEHWPAEHILKGILPPNCEVLTSFETIGHIAHVNLPDELLPYKKIIGKVLLDKNQPRVRTVVNKVGTIKNEFRVPTFEVLAGENDMVTEVKQYNATFKLDYGLVYWNSRLEQEHRRLVSEFQPGQIVCDMFAGIGPFAIPTAQKGCVVYANDLNPHSFKYLRINAELNKVDERIFSYNMDARDFMKEVVNPAKHALKGGQEDADGTSEARQNKRKHRVRKEQPEVKPWEHFDHVVMNLPASALSFLDNFKGLLSKNHWKGSMPRIHCYCFSKESEGLDNSLKIAETTIGAPLPGASIWEVRAVAPYKKMLCISFTLPESVAFGDADDREESGLKRPRTV